MAEFVDGCSISGVVVMSKKSVVVSSSKKSILSFVIGCYPRKKFLQHRLAVDCGTRKVHLRMSILVLSFIANLFIQVAEL